jgi:hypothetical protein
MPQVSKSKTLKIIWSKADIAIILGTTYYQLNNLIPESLKDDIGWGKGVGRFRDIDTLKVLRYFRGALNEEELRGLLYPGGRF